MAQIVWAATGFHAQGPQFYLLNANGPTMLRRAVRYAIEAKVDIILFSGDFEGGGNGDGRGPINQIVADALAANIIWINAAGNYGSRVYNGAVRIDPDGYLRFRGGEDGTALHFRNRLDENTVTVTLTWNDYQETEDAGTNKDLDLFVEDWQGRVIGASTKRQVSGKTLAGPDDSRNPRERVVLTDLAANPDFNYRIRIRSKSNNFTQADRIRVLVTSARESYMNPANGQPEEAVKFFEANKQGEIYPPADNPLVLTVGDASGSSSVGPTMDNRLKPDVIVPDSRAFFSDGEVTQGASNAAAYMASVVAVLKAAEPQLNIRHLLRLAREQVPSSAGDAAQGGTTRYRAYGDYIGASSADNNSYPRRSTGAARAPGGVIYGSPSALLRQFSVFESRGNRRMEVMPSPRAMAPPPNEIISSRLSPESLRERLVTKRTWQTPTRTQLADIVQSRK
jgi:hypothetical protein